MKIQISALALILLFNLGLVKAQKWTHYTDANSGLTSNSVSKIIVDTDNKKWIATYYGVSVFDGVSKWTTYTKTNSGLADNVVFDMAIDSLGNKWFATKNGVSKFNGTTWTTYNYSNSQLQTDQVYSIAIDKMGVIYFGQADNFISILNGNRWSYVQVQYGNMQYDVNEMCASNNGNLYFSLRYQNLFLLSGGNFYIFDNPNFRLYDQSVSSILVDDANSKVWIGTQYALNMLTSATMVKYDFLDLGIGSVNMSGILVDKNNRKWLGTSAGLMMFDGTNFTIYDTKNSGIPDNWVGSIAQDKDGIYWLENDGLTRFNPLATGTEEILNETSISIFPNPVQNSLHIDYNGKISNVQILDNQGRVLLNENEYKDEIDIEKLNPGIYFIQITTENGVATKSIIKS